jgi:hypothetical protein
MKLLTLLIAAALCGQAQEKVLRYESAIKRADGTPCQSLDLISAPDYVCVPAPPSLESRVEKLEKMLAPLNPGCVILASNPPQVSCPAEAGGAHHGTVNPPPSTIVFRDPSLGLRALSREEANALLVALANAINKASAQRAAEEWSREPKK